MTCRAKQKVDMPSKWLPECMIWGFYGSWGFLWQVRAQRQITLVLLHGHVC